MGARGCGDSVRACWRAPGGAVSGAAAGAGPVWRKPRIYQRDCVFAFAGVSPAEAARLSPCGEARVPVTRPAHRPVPVVPQEFELALLHRLNWDLNSVTSFDFVEQLLSRLALKTNARLIRRHAHTFIALCTTGRRRLLSRTVRSPAVIHHVSESRAPGYRPEKLRVWGLNPPPIDRGRCSWPRRPLRPGPVRWAAPPARVYTPGSPGPPDRADQLAVAANESAPLPLSTNERPARSRCIAMRALFCP